MCFVVQSSAGKFGAHFQNKLSGKQSFNDVPRLAVEQRLFTAVAFVGELPGMNSKQMQKRSMVVEVVDYVGDSVVSELIGCTVRATAFEATTS